MDYYKLGKNPVYCVMEYGELIFANNKINKIEDFLIHRDDNLYGIYISIFDEKYNNLDIHVGKYFDKYKDILIYDITDKDLKRKIKAKCIKKMIELISKLHKVKLENRFLVSGIYLKELEEL